MANERIVTAWKSYFKYIEDLGLTDEIIKAMLQCVKAAYADGDLDFAYEVSTQTKEFIRQRVTDATKGGTWEMLEDYAQQNKQNYDYINWYYEVLLAEAPYFLDSYCLYIERDRMRKDRFYEPRRKVMLKVVDAMQRLEDNKLDRLFIHMPARVGKTQITTFYTSWHCARDTEKSNLYVTYKEGLGGAFLDGVTEIYTDPTYRFADVFPRVKITATDAKNNKID